MRRKNRIGGLRRRSIAAVLMLSMLIWSAPAAGVYAAGSGSGRDSASGTETVNRNPAFAGLQKKDAGKDEETAEPGQAVILYAEGEVDTDAPKTYREKRAAKKAKASRRARTFGTSASSGGKEAVAEAENTLGRQAEILDDVLKDDYVIEDTIIFGAEEDGDQGSSGISEGDDRESSDTVISIISSEKKSTKELVRSLRKDKRILAAEPNYIYKASAMPEWNDKYLDDIWHLAGDSSINADKMWSSPQYKDAAADGSAEPVVVAVLDTGIDYTHPELAGRMWSMPKSKAFKPFYRCSRQHGYDFAYNDFDPMDENGHGTHCSGIIAAQTGNNEGIAGVAGSSDKVGLMAVRVLDEDGSGNLEDILAGYQYIIEMKKCGANVRAINCSLGASVTSDIFDQIIEEAGRAGILTVAAAGNETADNDLVPSSPANARSDYVISVAASDEDGSFASYSNYGKKSVDVVAPGSNILSSVSYNNYAPYLYDAATIRGYKDEKGEEHGGNTEYYGEFGGAEVRKVTNAQGEETDAVTPVTGTDYYGNEINTESDPAHQVGGFGESVMLVNRAKGSTGRASLEIMKENDTDTRPFPVGNNKDNLRWKITGASAGDEYILYFPYDKTAGDPNYTYMNIAFRPHTDEKTGSTGTLDVGDVMLNGIDKHGRAAWSDSVMDDYGYIQMDLDPTWNSIWQASGTTSVFYPYSVIKNKQANAGGSEETGHENEAADAEDGSAEEAAAEADRDEDSEPVYEVNEDGELVQAGTESAEGSEEATYKVNKNGELVKDTPSGSSEDTEEGSAGSQAAEGYGLGFVYRAENDGDAYIDISSMAISVAEPDESTFGCYDVYSGTSMATPVTAGTVAMIAAMNPGMNAADVRSTLFASTNDEFGGWVSTGGGIDLGRYTAVSGSSKPAIGSCKADFGKGTVTLSGKGFSKNAAVSVHNNITGTDRNIREGDIRVSDDGRTITLYNAGARTSGTDSAHYGIIGSDITFTVACGSAGKGQATYYVVDGLQQYSDGYEFVAMSNDGFDFFRKSGQASSSGADDILNDGDGELPVEDFDPSLPTGLNFITGANELLLYDGSGVIYRIAYDNDLKKYNNTQVGTDPASAVTEYVKGILADESRRDSLWRPSSKSQEKSLDYFNISCISNPAYMGGSVYELVRADMGYKASTMLLGLRLDEDPQWTVLYDSLEDLGSAPDELSWADISETTLAGYKGRLYIIGSFLEDMTYDYGREDAENSPENGEDEEFNDEDIVYDYTEEDIQTAVFSCAPVKKGSDWRKESAAMPAPRARGTAINQGGNLYYVLSTKSYSEVDYTVYKFNGKTWSTAGTLPEAVYIGEKGGQVIDLGFFQIFLGGYAGIPCAVGADDKGLVFGGMSFDGAGDTFRFNTSSGRTEPLGYTLWSVTADRPTAGTVADGKLWVQYDNDVEEKIIGKNVPAGNAYVRLKRSIAGEGTGLVSGGEYYTRGEASDITILADEGCYIYSASSTGTAKALDLQSLTGNYASGIKARQRAVTVNYPAKKDGTLDIYFGRISTSITAPARLTRTVGRKSLDIYTDGTVSDVSLKSSNTKYAKVNSDGTVTFRKAGVGKTVIITAAAKDNPKVTATCKVRIKSRTAKKFKWFGKKVTMKTKVQIDRNLGKAFAPKKLKARVTAKTAGKKSKKTSNRVKLTWKKGSKTKGLKGYIILRKTGKGRFVQIAKVGVKKRSYIDKKVKKGKTYRYIVTGYKKDGKTLLLTRPCGKAKVKVKATKAKKTGASKKSKGSGKSRKSGK